MRPWDDIDDLTDIYINQVVYPDEDAEQDDRHVVPRTDFVEMPRSIFVTQVCSFHWQVLYVLLSRDRTLECATNHNAAFLKCNILIGGPF